MEQMLQKYISTGDERRLKIFVKSVNPDFKINKDTTELLALLIEDYKTDATNYKELLRFLGYKVTKEDLDLEAVTKSIDEAILRAQPLVKYNVLDEKVEMVLGKVTDENSIAFKLLNGSTSSFKIVSAYKPETLIAHLFRKNFKEQDNQWHSFIEAGENGSVWHCTTNPEREFVTTTRM